MSVTDPTWTDPLGPAIPNLWADPLAPDLFRVQYVEHLYAVEMWCLPVDLADVPAWDITVDLDGGRSPYATATFKAPTSYMEDSTLVVPRDVNGEPLTPATVFDITAPLAAPIVKVTAGWRYTDTGGGNHSHQAPIFSGVITGRRLVVEGGETYVEFKAESFEVIYGYPAKAALAVNNAYTTMQEFFPDWTDSFPTGPFWRGASVDAPISPSAPTAGQLTEYRAMALEVGDDVQDFMGACASALGQWVRGERGNTPTIEVLKDPYPYARLWTLPVSMFSRLDRSEDLDQWANVLQLETRWTDPSTGDTKSKRKTYASADATSGAGAVRARPVTIAVKPPGGSTPSSTWPTGLRWLRRVDEASRGSYQAEARALWWLQPRVDGIALADSPIGDTPGAVQRVTFLVDQGLMNLTWSAVHD